ncbi:TonB-dependent receptor plug domain-containing protein [Phenylobacterium sp.]|jgi:iron complex outermembrane receptor protein|uniref:TonB-dependent receptor plug domain-containing protein n=1 Tax=Phenylobacterium sp. TaxID=1871053 RepID=UPI002F938B61
MGISKTALCATTAFAAFAFSAPAALAQTDGTVEELIVTAQKREQSLLDVAGAISALGADALQERGIRTAQDLQYQVPSLQAGTGFNTTVLFIRDVGQTVGQPGVAMHVDGVYQARSLQTALSQVDLARVEVLRGPQGTLYGRNATAGAVNFITNAPTNEFEGFATRVSDARTRSTASSPACGWGTAASPGTVRPVRPSHPETSGRSPALGAVTSSK